MALVHLLAGRITAFAFLLPALTISNVNSITVYMLILMLCLHTNFIILSNLFIDTSTAAFQLLFSN